LDSRNAQTTLRSRSAHVCAKLNFFSSCVGVSKKNADTEDIRNKRKQIFCFSATLPVIDKNFKANGTQPLCYLRLPRVMAGFGAGYERCLCNLSWLTM
jgi:hypothetical protein